MSKDWRDKRKEQRERLVNASIERCRERARKSDYIVRSIETEDILVFPAGRYILSDGKRRVETNRFLLLSDTALTFEAGVTKKANGDNFVLVRVTDYKDKDSVYTFEGPNALDEAISVFQGISLMLRGIRKERRETE